MPRRPAASRSMRISVPRTTESGTTDETASDTTEPLNAINSTTSPATIPWSPADGDGGDLGRAHERDDSVLGKSAHRHRVAQTGRCVQHRHAAAGHSDHAKHRRPAEADLASGGAHQCRGGEHDLGIDRADVVHRDDRGGRAGEHWTRANRGGRWSVDTRDAPGRHHPPSGSERGESCESESSGAHPVTL